MVARNEILTPTSEAEDLAEAFREETKAMLKKVALENNCDVEELKFSVNNTGVVNIQRMTPEEMAERNKLSLIERRKKEIRRTKGIQ